MLVSREDFLAWRGAQSVSPIPAADEGAVVTALSVAEMYCYADTGRTFASAVAEREYTARGSVLRVDDFTEITSVSVGGAALNASRWTAKRPSHDRPYDRIEFASPIYCTVTVAATWGWGELVPPGVKLGICQQAEELLALRLTRGSDMLGGSDGMPATRWAISNNARALWGIVRKPVLA